ncbi:hypothetical protein L484_007833 [Morus notabilis]|uniref:Protein ABIL2 n=1 Tax=Morus notabilis TaxID=981085 RepID=W9RWC7_9ROSA|nr:hypothetical protein L484_007833 [Morus notabilis]
MESVNFTSSVSAPKPSHHDELFMQQRMVFSESLNELKNLRKQLYSAAEYFELSYSKDDQKQIVVETLKDYTIKAFINTVDHLGSMADKVNNFVDEKTVDVSEADLKFSCIEQRQRTSQDLIDRSGLFQQSLAFSFPRHHKRYIIPGKYALLCGAAKNAIGQSNLMYHGVENDWFQFRNERKEPANHFPHSGLVKRSTTVNSSASKQRYPTEPWRSVSMSIHTERDRAKSPEHSGLNRRILKALVSMRKRKKDATSNKYNFNGN